MTTETVHVTMPEKTYDMSKSDSWTQEQWDEWHGDHYHIDEWSLQILDSAEIHLAIRSIYYYEHTEYMYFQFKAQNKLAYDLSFELLQWDLDGIARTLVDQAPILLRKQTLDYRFDKGIAFPFMGNWEQATLQIKLTNDETNEHIRTFNIIITKKYTPMF